MNFKKIFSSLIVLLIFAFLLNSIFSNVKQLKDLELNVQPLELIILCFLAVLVYPVNAFTWHLVLKSLRVNINFLNSYKIWVISNSSRYIPGGFWHYLGRVFLSKTYGIKKSKATTSLIIESAITLLTGCLVVITSIIFFNLEIDFFKILFIIAGLIVLSLSIIIFSNRKVNILILTFFTKISGKKIPTDLNLRGSFLPLLIGSCFLQFIIDGILLFFVTTSITNINFESAPVFIGIFALSWMIGYLSFLTPAGIGIQELGIAMLLSLYIPFPTASLVAILFRLALIFGELCSIAFVFMFVKKGS